MNPPDPDDWGCDIDDYGNGTATCPYCKTDAGHELDPPYRRGRWYCYECGHQSEWRPI